MILNEKKGDLFELDDKYVLAHCISEDCAMGAGIAIEFQKRYRNMKSYCTRVILSNNLKHPCVIPYFEEEVKVFNLITKRVYYGKPTYATLTKCIKEMAFMCKTYNIKYLAMPKIGCGLDRLQWGKVREIIKKEFEDVDIEIEVRYL